MSNTHPQGAEYPSIELSQKLNSFWMSLSEEQRKSIGAEVTMIIGFQGSSYWIMETIAGAVKRIVPGAEGNFRDILWNFYTYPDEIRKAAQSQLTQYFISRNQ